jgi:Ca2+-binding EF-hand superfamily protein
MALAMHITGGDLMSGKLFLTICAAAVLAPAAVHAAPKAGDIEKRFKNLDKDADGKLTFAEFNGGKSGTREEDAKKFLSLDTNRDKKLTLEEYSGMWGKPKKKK